MYTFEAVERFINSCLDYAIQCPENALTFQSQAFGVVRFVSENCYKTQAELEQKVINAWNENWNDQFTKIWLSH